MYLIFISSTPSAIINTLILFPTWLIWLGKQLPQLRSKYEEDVNNKERAALTGGNADEGGVEEAFVIEDDDERAIT